MPMNVHSLRFDYCTTLANVAVMKMMQNDQQLLHKIGENGNVCVLATFPLKCTRPDVKNKNIYTIYQSFVQIIVMIHNSPTVPLAQFEMDLLKSSTPQHVHREFPHRRPVPWQPAYYAVHRVARPTELCWLPQSGTSRQEW